MARALQCRWQWGWAVLIAAASALTHAQQPVIVQSLECRGDDPAWRFDATRTTALYTLQSAKGKREVVFRGALQALASPPPQTIVWRGDSTHLPRDTLVVTLREEACRFAPTDAAPASHRAVVSVRAGEAATGCCLVRAGFDARVAPAANFAAKPAADWSRLLPDLLPAINACLAREGARAKGVASAAPTPAGMAQVRIIATTGPALECSADVTGRGTPKISAVAVADPPPPASVAAAEPPAPAAAGPLFYPPREPPPVVSCGRLERALSLRGTLLGYLHYDPC